MLTDIFARRYDGRQLWSVIDEKMRRMLVQAFRLLEERVCPYWVQGAESTKGKAFWNELQSRLSMELGLRSLSSITYAYPSTFNGKPFTQTGTWTMNKVCENWYMDAIGDNVDMDRYIKERLSLIEIGFRLREEEIKQINANLEQEIAADFRRRMLRGQLTHGRGVTLHGDPGAGLRAANAKLNSEFQQSVCELNTRFRQANSGLNYHNGFIQLSADPVTGEHIEAPFWHLVADKRWANVDIDMKEAVDRRDTNGRDPAWYAARALESAIKIISSANGWASGNERGAHSYIDKLSSRNAAFLEKWEADFLKSYFTLIRNPHGHGPGDQPMVQLTAEQNTFAIEVAMVWIKMLIQRFST